MSACISTTRPRPATWALILAFALVYLSWGTTYLAIKEGVRTLPPALFGGTRIVLAGLILLGYLILRGESLRLSRGEWLWAAVGGLFLFVGGNGMISYGQKSIESSEASILVATTPLFIALLERFWPGADRLTWRGWLGLLAGLTGVAVLLLPRLRQPAALLGDIGPLLVLGSAFAWAFGSLILRYRKRGGSHWTSAALQMVLGGIALSLLGLAMGEGRQLSAASFTPAAVYSFFHLLIVGSLIGFVSFTWLLQHVSATLAGTYAYVNPLVAILVGWLLGGEAITVWIAGGMIVILLGVFLVRSGGVRGGAGMERARERIPVTSPRANGSGPSARPGFSSRDGVASPTEFAPTLDAGRVSRENLHS